MCVYQYPYIECLSVSVSQYIHAPCVCISTHAYNILCLSIPIHPHEIVFISISIRSMWVSHYLHISTHHLFASVSPYVHTPCVCISITMCVYQYHHISTPHVCVSGSMYRATGCLSGSIQNIYVPHTEYSWIYPHTECPPIPIKASVSLFISKRSICVSHYLQTGHMCISVSPDRAPVSLFIHKYIIYLRTHIQIICVSQYPETVFVCLDIPIQSMCAQVSPYNVSVLESQYRILLLVLYRVYVSFFILTQNIYVQVFHAEHALLCISLWCTCVSQPSHT